MSFSTGESTVKKWVKSVGRKSLGFDANEVWFYVFMAIQVWQWHAQVENTNGFANRNDDQRDPKNSKISEIIGVMIHW